MTHDLGPSFRAAVALGELLEPGDLARLAAAAAAGPALLAGAGGAAAQGMRVGGPWDTLVVVLDHAARLHNRPGSPWAADRPGG